MNRTSAVGMFVTTALVTLAACDTTNLSSPRAPANASFAKSGASGVTCTITLPAPAVRPLPAVRETARELNEAFSKSSSLLSCGTINGLNARFNTLVSLLDRSSDDQNLDAACGVATGLSHELEALVNQGKFNPIVTHPPEASNNVVENMQFITSMFCENAKA